MDYFQIKKLAHQEAEDDEIDGVLASELREKLIKGETAS